jgi:hypothetical protein
MSCINKKFTQVFRNFGVFFLENEKNVIFTGFFCILGIKINELATFGPI